MRNGEHSVAAAGPTTGNLSSGSPASGSPAAGGSTVDGALLSVEQLSVDFAAADGWVRVVESVDLHVNSGEILALVGESGSGKSVTSLAIAGLLPQRIARVADGRVNFEGVDLLTLSEKELRPRQGRDLAMVFQEPMTSLNPTFTIGEQIAESLRVHLGMSRRDAPTRVAELLDEVGIPDAASRLGAYPHEFSGGMRQRVMIAMAIACGPKLLIADEPTTALDVTVQAQITDLIRRLSHERDMAVIFITHDFGVVAELADRVTVLYGGQVVENSDVDPLFEEPRHPYTQGLLHSVASLEGLGDISWIPGSPPVPGTFPLGCRFAPRCQYAIEQCSADQVPLTHDGHRSVRCVRAEELTLKGPE